MNRIQWLMIACTILCAGMVHGANDVTTGVICEGVQPQSPTTVLLPDDFDVEAASAAIREARRAGDHERVSELAAQLSAWQEMNAGQIKYADEHGYNADPPAWNTEDENPPYNSPDWGNDVRIAPENGVRGVKIASISNGHLYTIAFNVVSSLYHVMMHRSTNNGQTWTQYWDFELPTDNTVSSVGILNCNDTLITWYILKNPSDYYRTWVRVVLPGAVDNPIYYGSPTGIFNPVMYTDLHVTTDAPVWGTSEYVYATWCERYGTGPDSTRVMSAVSTSIDVTAWETGPTRIGTSSGANIYYIGTKTAYGSISDRMWLIAWLHPYNYPTSYDRSIKGWYSNNYGLTWSTRIDITSSTNDIDEYDCALAGSHSNTNWVVLATQDSVATGVETDVNCWYSTDDGATWNFRSWVYSMYNNFLGDVWVDDNSNAFYGACRSITSTEQHVRYKEGSISDPNTWTTSVVINDNMSNVSNVFGPSVSRNMGNGDAIMAWTDYYTSIYSIWFDSYSWTGVAELPTNELAKINLRLAPNPAGRLARLTYSVSTPGTVSITLFDAAGRLVDNLLHETKPAGDYAVELNNQALAAGIYFVRVETPDGTGTKTMTIVK